MKSSKFVVAALCTIWLLTGCALHKENTSRNGDYFTNPLLEVGPDPWAIYVDGYYYHIQSRGGQLVLRKTHDITDLRNAEKKTKTKS